MIHRKHRLTFLAQMPIKKIMLLLKPGPEKEIMTLAFINRKMDDLFLLLTFGQIPSIKMVHLNSQPINPAGCLYKYTSHAH